MRKLAQLLATVVLIPVFAGSAAAQSPSPLPSPGTGPSARRAPSPNRTLSIVCASFLYSWPDGESRPTLERGIAPVQLGNTYGLVFGPRYTLDARGFYETSIDVVTPWGAGMHYWVPERCAIPST